MMETTRSAKNTSASLVATRLHHTLITTRPEVGRRGERRGCGREREAYSARVRVFKGLAAKRKREREREMWWSRKREVESERKEERKRHMRCVCVCVCTESRMVVVRYISIIRYFLWSAGISE